MDFRNTFDGGIKVVSNVTNLHIMKKSQSLEQQPVPDSGDFSLDLRRSTGYLLRVVWSIFYIISFMVRNDDDFVDGS